MINGARSLERGDLRRARFHFALAYRNHPGEPLVALAWGRELLRHGQADRAVALLRGAWEADRKLIAAGFSLARALGLHLGQVGEADDVLAEIESHHGVSATSLLIRGELALQDPGRPDVARRLFRRAEESGADPHVVRLGMARAANAEGIELAEQGEHDRALFALKHASDLSPDWSTPLVNRGAVFDRLGLWRRAQGDYRAALAIDPFNPIALFNLGALLKKRGARAEAQACFERLLAVQPSDPAAQRALAETLTERSAPRPRR